MSIDVDIFPGPPVANVACRALHITQVHLGFDPQPLCMASFSTFDELKGSAPEQGSFEGRQTFLLHGTQAS